jgi:MFS family permease
VHSSIKTLRSALYSIVPIMATEMGLSPVQAGTLLTGFFPGYLLTQMPAGPLVQRYGGKLTLSVCLFGTAGCFLLAPLAMARGGVVAMSALLSLNGLLTGPMMPTLQQLNRDWIPDGDADENQERPLVVRIQNLAHNSAPMLGAFLTPLLARGGWKRAFYTLGGVVGVWGVIWHTMVNSSRGGNSAPAPVKAAESEDTKQPAEAEKVTEWRIFTLKPVIALICWQVASNFLFAVLQILGPTVSSTQAIILGSIKRRNGLDQSSAGTCFDRLLAITVLHGHAEGQPGARGREFTSDPPVACDVQAISERLLVAPGAPRGRAARELPGLGARRHGGGDDAEAHAGAGDVEDADHRGELRRGGVCAALRDGLHGDRRDAGLRGRDACEHVPARLEQLL